MTHIQNPALVILAVLVTMLVMTSWKAPEILRFVWWAFITVLWWPVAITAKLVIWAWPDTWWPRKPRESWESRGHQGRSRARRL